MSIITGISTAIGSGAISIVRISGNGALELALRFFTCKRMPVEPVPNMMYLGSFRGNGFMDKCMLVYFKAPRSYTGEDMVEFHLHGGVYLTQSVLRTLIENGAKLADRGEFTKRAFFNNKLSLDEAEGVLGIIEAESQAEITASYSLIKGKLSKKLEQVTEDLTNLIVFIEANIDFPEEMEDEEFRIPETIERVMNSLYGLIKTSTQGRLVRNGISVAIAGKPNAGKSSLLNAFLREDRAIVTDIPGTTRDTISESLVHNGIRINLLDTAGIRESNDKVERIGVERSLKAIEGADVVIYLLAPEDDERDIELTKSAKGKVIIVNSKKDLLLRDNGYPSISSKTNEGVEELLDLIAKEAGSQSQYGELLTLDRHIDAVNRAYEAMLSASNELNTTSLDCLLIDLHTAYSALMEIDGGTATEQVINEIFSRFCVGK